MAQKLFLIKMFYFFTIIFMLKAFIYEMNFQDDEMEISEVKTKNS